MADVGGPLAMIEGTPPRLEGIGRHSEWRAVSRLGYLSVYRVELLWCMSVQYARRGCE